MPVSVPVPASVSVSASGLAAAEYGPKNSRWDLSSSSSSNSHSHSNLPELHAPVELEDSDVHPIEPYSLVQKMIQSRQLIAVEIVVV